MTKNMTACENEKNKFEKNAERFYMEDARTDHPEALLMWRCGYCDDDQFSESSIAGIKKHVRQM